MRNCAEGFFREVHAAGKPHVTGLFARIDDPPASEAPGPRRGKRHGGIDESIAKLCRDFGGEVMRNEHMLSQRHTGPVLFGAAGVVNRRGLARSDRVTHFGPCHVFDKQ